MPNTPIWAIPYAGANDAPNGPGQEQSIAVAVEAALNTLYTPPVCALTTNQVTPMPVPANGAGTAVGFDVTLRDPLGMLTSVNTVTIKKAGFYSLRGSVTFSANAGGSRFLSFLTTGSNAGEFGRTEVPANTVTGRATTVNTAVEIPLAVGDTVQLLAWQSSTATLFTTIQPQSLSRITVRFICP